MSFPKRTAVLTALVVSVFTGAKQLIVAVSGITQSHIAVQSPKDGGTTG